MGCAPRTSAAWAVGHGAWSRQDQRKMVPLATATDIPRSHGGKRIALPALHFPMGASLPEVMRARRSVRAFGEGAISLGAVGQLLWAAQGVSGATGYRTVPSAGALYPLEAYLVAGEVRDLDVGVYRYVGAQHRLSLIQDGDRRPALAAAALEQSWIADARIVIALAGLYQRSAAKYGQRAVRYVHMESGHAAQNVCLMATFLGLGTTVVGAFRDQEVQAIVGLPSTEHLLCLLPVGPI